MSSNRVRGCSGQLRIISLVVWALCGLANVGCVEHALREGREPMDYGPHETEPQNDAADGAIWAGTTPSGSFLFFDQKARGVGDLVTVLIDESMEADSRALTELDSTRKLAASIESDVGLASLVAVPIRTIIRWFGVPDPGSVAGPSANIIDADAQNKFDGEGKTERSGKFKGEMTCRVIEVLPSGLMHIRGRRYVVVNHEAQFVSIEGLLRREDIGIDNTVASTALAEARITYDGLGVIDDKQRSGWLARVFDWVFPY